MQIAVSKAPFSDIGIECTDGGVEGFWARLRSLLAGGVTERSFGIPSDAVGNARDRFPGSTVLICKGREDDTLAAWGSAGTSCSSSGGLTDVDGSGMDDDIGRGKIGDGFARTTITESGNGVDVSRCAGNDGGRYGYSRTGVRNFLLDDLTASHRFWHIRNLGRSILYGRGVRGFLGTGFVNINRRCDFWYIDWFWGCG